MIKLLIFCRSYILGEGLKKLLEENETFTVIAIGCTNEEFEWMIGFEHDLIICDGNCFEEVLKHFKDDDFRVLLINDSMHPDLYYSHLQDLVKRGLVGILSPKSDALLFQKAIQTVIAGEMWIDHETIRKSLCSSERTQRDMNLTKREKQVLGFICTGASNKEIANKLFVTEQTVKSHCNKLFKKFGVTNRVGLALKGNEARTVLGLQ
jgi:DNA-binding NarL/FixJ family response regulator